MFFKALSFAALLLALAACGPGEENKPVPPALPPAAGPAADDDSAVLEEPDWSEVVATVNGEPIIRRLLASQVAMSAAERPLEEAEAGIPEEGKAWAAALEIEELRNLIILELACQEALRLGYAPAEAELNEALAYYENDLDEPEQVYRVLDQYGSTKEDLKKQLAKNMALKKWQDNEFLAEITVGEAEARDFYQAHLDQLRHDEMLRLSQVLVGVSLLAPPAAKDRARDKAEAAFKRLAAGDDFGSVAAEVNADPEAAENLGDQGWFVRGQTLPAIEAEIWKLPVGSHTGVLETILGFHIVKVTDRRPPGVEPFDSLKPDLIAFISSRKLQEALNRKIWELIRAADIEISDPALSGARPTAEAERAE
ncbi:MAG: peptidylprolyl isomerase [Candidatus Adiutrix sp.]|nr:peptidylprolyl isomerase [Candidatus Adiutrix sp.]